MIGLIPWAKPDFNHNDRKKKTLKHAGDHGGGTKTINIIQSKTKYACKVSFVSPVQISKSYKNSNYKSICLI